MGFFRIPRGVFAHALVLGFMICCMQSCYAEDDVVDRVNDVFCIFIYLIEFVAGGIASLVILLMGLKYLTSSGDSESRYVARTGIIGAFVGLVIIIISVPIVNLVASGLLGTVDCGYLPDLSGSGGSETAAPRSPENIDPVEPGEKSADISAEGLVLTKSVEDIKKDGYKEFPLYFQLANVGGQSSPDFMNTVSMVSGMTYFELCKVRAVGLPAEDKTVIYPCTGADMEKVKELMESGAQVTLILKADSDGLVTDSNRDNNELSKVLSSVPVEQIDDDNLGDTGGIAINYVKEYP